MKKLLIYLMFLTGIAVAQIDQPYNVIDIRNSTKANLAGNGIFTGYARDVIGGGNYGLVTIFVSSDQNSATNGLKVYFSNDSLIWRDSSSYTVIGGTPRSDISFTPKLRYYKIKYTNGSSVTTSFLISSIMHEYPVSTSSSSSAGTDSSASRLSLILNEQNNQTPKLTTLNTKSDSLIAWFSRMLTEQSKLPTKQDTVAAWLSRILTENSKLRQPAIWVKLDSMGTSTTDTIKQFWFNSGSTNQYSDGFFTLFDSTGINDTFYVQRADTLDPYRTWTNVQIAYIDLNTTNLTAVNTGQYGISGNLVIIPGSGLVKTYYINEPYPRLYRIWVSKYAVRNGRHIFIKWTAKQR